MTKWIMVYVLMLVFGMNIVAAVIAPFPFNIALGMIVPASAVVLAMWYWSKP